MSKLKLLLVLLLGLTVVTGCKPTDDGNKESASSSNTTNTKLELTTDITESTHLAEGVKDGVFTKDGYGKVTLVNHTDGDTTNFKDSSGETFALRYYGVNTPESTAKIQPWGLKASAFTKEKLLKATDIYLERDAAEIKTGKRYLGLVWLKDAEHLDYYCLNLLLVEQAYSENQLFDKNSNYLDAFVAAGERAKATGERVYGKKNDPDFDYSNKIHNVSINEVYDNYDEFYTNSTKLCVTGMITSFDLNGLYLSSYTLDEDAGINKYYHIYAFTFGAALPKKFKEGSIVQLYCMAGQHPATGEKQLSNVITSALDEHAPVLIENRDVIRTTITTDTVLEEYVNAPVQADLVVSNLGKPSENSGDVTLWCTRVDNGEKLNVRIPSNKIPTYEPLFVKGKKIRVQGQLKIFMDNYQIAISGLDQTDKAIVEIVE